MSQCPNCTKRLLARHAGPLHLGVDDVVQPEVQQNGNKIGSDSISTADDKNNENIDEKSDANDKIVEADDAAKQQGSLCGKSALTEMSTCADEIGKEDNGILKKH